MCALVAYYLAVSTENKARVLIGADAWVLDKFVRGAGPGYARVVASVSKRNGLQ